jgi:hypothetical protein
VPSSEFLERGATASSSSSEWTLRRRVTVTLRRLGRERPSASELDGEVMLAGREVAAARGARCSVEEAEEEKEGCECERL